MELMSAEELYEISNFLKKKEEPIADALLRAAKNGSVELFVQSLDEDTIKNWEIKDSLCRKYISI